MAIFFFQAEDGIRDLVRSRGLGDVYKRQAQLRVDRMLVHLVRGGDHDRAVSCGLVVVQPPIAVSYTHLTLPTSDLV